MSQRRETESTKPLDTTLHPARDASAAIRETAVGDIEEANAAIGAALCSAHPIPPSFTMLLRSVQSELLALSLAIDYSEAGCTAPDVEAIDRLRAAVRHHHRTEQPPPEFTVLGGSTDSIGLLRLARMVVRRACRSVKALAPTDQGGRAAAYLVAVAELLLVLAWECELMEQQNLPVGGAC